MNAANSMPISATTTVPRTVTNKMGDLELLIPKLRSADSLPSIPKPPRRMDQGVQAFSGRPMQNYVKKSRDATGSNRLLQSDGPPKTSQPARVSPQRIWV